MNKIFMAVAAILLLLYAGTWALGVPRVRSDLRAYAASKWEGLRKSAAVQVGYPKFRIKACYAVLPGIIVCHYDLLLQPEAGEITRCVYLWYGFGVRKVSERPVGYY
jgi:hypothetical protein